MKYLILSLLALSMLNCGRDKESMAGSYKLEKPTEARLAGAKEPYFSLNIDDLSSAKGELPYKVKSYSEGNNFEGTVIKEGSFSLKQVHKNEKILLLLSVSEKSAGEDITISKAIKTTTEIATWKFTQDEVSYLALAKCENESCTKLKFFISASNPKDKEHHQAFAIYLKQTLENEIYVFNELCQITQSDQMIQSIENPQLIFSLNENTAELKCIKSN